MVSPLRLEAWSKPDSRVTERWQVRGSGSIGELFFTGPVAFAGCQTWGGMLRDVYKSVGTPKPSKNRSVGSFSRR